MTTDPGPCPACDEWRAIRRHTPDELRQWHTYASPYCPACQNFRRHTKDERTLFHPLQESKK